MVRLMPPDRCSSCKRPWGLQTDMSVVGPFDQSDVCVDCHRYETDRYKASERNDRRERDRIKREGTILTITVLR